MAPPISHLASTRYSLVIDAGSSGSRLQIYSWQDPEAERQEIISTVNERWRERQAKGKKGKGKGKGKAEAKDELEWEIESALRRLVKVEKGAPGDLWIKKAEPGKHDVLGRQGIPLTCGRQESLLSLRNTYRNTSHLSSPMHCNKYLHLSTRRRPSTCLQRQA